MRKLLIVAVLATVALGGAAACTSGTPGTGTTTPVPTTAPADQTRDVCTEALTVEKAQTTAAVTTFQQMLADMAAGNTANIAKYQADFVAALTTFTTKFTELSAKPIKPEVKTALANYLTYLGQIQAQASNTTYPQVQAKFAELESALTAACA